MIDFYQFSRPNKAGVEITRAPLIRKYNNVFKSKKLEMCRCQLEKNVFKFIHLN